MPLTDDPWLPYNQDGSVPTIRTVAPVTVYRFDGASSLFALPNVECLSISIREGTDPGSARFRYNLASGLSGAPVSIETALGTDDSGDYVINAGDRLVVQASDPSGNIYCLFDGLAIDFGMGLDPEIEEVDIGAVGIAWHCWDNVIPGALQRNSGAARVIYDTLTALPAQFNPGGLPNCSPDGYMSGYQGSGNDFRYPTFVDPAVIQSPDVRTFWTLNKALRYIIFNLNPLQQYVANPDGTYLDGLLKSPGTNGDTAAPIPCPDTPITGKDWPGTVHRLVAECGFGTAFTLSTVAGLPKTSFAVFGNQTGTVKSLYLVPRGGDFDPTTCNFNASRLHRDLSDVVNQQMIVGGLNRWEASFILAPGFPMQAADAASLSNFDSSNPLFLSTNRNLYRLYIFDECGEGHYQQGSSTVIPLDPSLDGLFGKGLYCDRRRPGIGTLISVDPITNRKYEARLSISTNYANSNSGMISGLWDGTGQWQPITSTTWRLLDDRLGIEITEGNPNKWEIGTSINAGDPYRDGVVNGVEAQATTVTGVNFWLRLTCVVEADQAMAATAIPSGNSPLPQIINRVMDASDRYRNEYVDYPSEFNASGNNDLNPRNDQPAALAEAQAIRAQLEAGVLEGPVVIPRLTTYYGIGDRIGQIEGRNLGLRTDQGAGNPVYPVVIGVTYGLGPDAQTTTLELSDAGSVRLRYRRAAPRKPYSTNQRFNSMPGDESAPDGNTLMGGGYGGYGGPAPVATTAGGSP
jgi:hypothetical protein